MFILELMQRLVRLAMLILASYYMRSWVVIVEKDMYILQIVQRLIRLTMLVVASNDMRSLRFAEIYIDTF